MTLMFQNMWIYEWRVKYISPVGGATANAQLVTKDSYCIINEDTDLSLTIYNFAIWQNATFYFYLDNYHRVIKAGANKFSSEEYYVYLKLLNYSVFSVQICWAYLLWPPVLINEESKT